MVAEQDIIGRIQQRRRDLGMPYRVVAERSGLGVRAVQSVLTGKATPRLDTILSIAQALGVGIGVAQVNSERAMRERQAKLKAGKLAAIAQGSAALEGQAATDTTLTNVRRRIMNELLAGPNLRLWS
ncbi:MAG: helix-turn-helix domain-containing protein [Planctomycetota bacterium]|jgi:transcriptional regulator with XRE-family HTH domain